MRFADAALSGNEESIKKWADVIRRLGYDFIAVEGIERYVRFNGVAAVPRITFTDPRSVGTSGRGNKLRVFRVESRDKFKLTNKVLSSAHAIEIGGALLSRLGKRSLEKLMNVKAHVIVKAVEVYERLIKGASLLGLVDLLRLYERGRITLSLGSGGDLTVFTGLNHGLVHASILISLGLSEAKAIAAITTNPASLMRRAGYVIK